MRLPIKAVEKKNTKEKKSKKKNKALPFQQPLLIINSLRFSPGIEVFVFQIIQTIMGFPKSSSLRNKRNRKRLARVRQIVQKEQKLENQAYIYKLNDQVYVVLYFRKFVGPRKNKKPGI